MNRIGKAYEGQFRRLLEQAGARRLDQGVAWLVDKAQRLSLEQRLPLPRALTRIYENLAAKLGLDRPDHRPSQFSCDAGLGGLARWLRAAGYEARWQPDIADDELVQEAHKLSTTILTTDSMLMERRLLRDRVIPAFWLPPALSIAEQLRLVFREFGLTVREPRCMSCGGELRRAAKESLRERIPPRTYRWLDEYFVCARCNKLFWHGTHWEKISRQLRAIKRQQEGLSLEKNSTAIEKSGQSQQA